MSDSFSVSVDDTSVLARFDVLPEKMRTALQAKCGALSLQLEAKVKGKLSGDVLNVVSGRLRRSIFSDVYVDADGVHAFVASSADVPYAAIHEFGFVGTEHVREYIRSAHSNVAAAAHGAKVEISAAAGLVRAHDRQMNMPERSFMRSSLAEMHDDIVSGLQDAVRSAAAQ